MPYRFAFLIEQTLGHVTHAQNLAAAVARDASVEPAWLPVPYRCDDWIGRVPVLGRNWTFKLSLRARRRFGDAGGASSFDAAFFHTQVIAHGVLDRMPRLPCVVSLDATPAGRAAVEARAGNIPHRRPRRFATRWTSAVFSRAAAVVAWSRWAADSVSRDYGIDAVKVHVIPPGVDTEAWRPRRSSAAAAGRLPRLLFIGGDFRRKGGPELLSALAGDLGRTCELDVVTGSNDVAPRPGVRVHRGMVPNADSLRDLVCACDIMVLPTKKDFTPLAILEAAACGLPVIATDVAGIPEQVEHGVSGLIVPVNDPTALSAATRTLVSDPPRAARMGAAGRARIERLFCAERNAAAVTTLMRRLADERRTGAAGAPTVETAHDERARRSAGDAPQRQPNGCHNA